MRGWWALGAVCVVSVLLVVVLGTRLTFFSDDWYFLLQRPGLASKPGLDEFLAPHNGHLELCPAIAYKLFVVVFGLGLQLPFRLALGLAVAAVGIAVYGVVVTRSGVVLALCAAAIVVLLGPAWEALLLFNAVSIVGSSAFGLAALWALAEDAPGRNAVACALLVGAVCMSNAGLPFVVAATVALLLRRRISQVWVAGIPAAVFAVWFAAYGHTAPSPISGTKLAHLPKYVLDSAAMGLTSIFGVNHGVGAGHYTRGYVLLALLTALMVVRVVKRGRPQAFALVVATAALVFWGLTGSSSLAGRDPFASRYQLLDAALILVFAAAFFAPLRPSRAVTAAICILTLFAVASNLYTLLNYGYPFMRAQSAFAKADLGALEIAARRAAPDTWLTATVARNPYLSGVTAARYFSVTSRHGDVPVASPAQIAAAPADQRRAADSVLASAYRVARGEVQSRGSGRCRTTRTPAEITLANGDALITNRGARTLVLSVRRFAPVGQVNDVAFVGSGTTVRTHIPKDAVTVSWHVGVRALRGAGMAAMFCVSGQTPTLRRPRTRPAP
jgi:hypothetical protein